VSAEALHRALVLHRRAHGDSSLLVEVFAMGRGRFAAMARGARGGKGTRAALLQPFQPLWLGVVGRGEVRTLTRVEAADRAFALAGKTLACAFYLNELLLRLLPREEPQDALFAFYHAALARLSEAPEPDSALRHFELRLLAELGYGPTLDRECDDATPIRPEALYWLDEDRGGISPAPPSADGVRLSGATLLALARGEDLNTETARREARWLSRCLLAPHLGSRPLRSRELYRQWLGVRASVCAAPQTTEEFSA